MTRTIFGVCLLIACICFAAVNVACGSALALNSADQQQITDDAAKIAACEQQGLACQNSDAGHKCYDVYAACMQDAGESTGA